MVKIYEILNDEQFSQLEIRSAKIVNYDNDLTVGSKGYNVSRNRRIRLRKQSKMPDASVGWSKMSAAEKKSWKDLSKQVGGTSWQSYLKNVIWDRRDDPVELGDGDFGALEYAAGYAAMPATAAKMADYSLPGNIGQINYGTSKYGGKNLKLKDDPTVLWSGLASRFLIDATGRTVEWVQAHPQSYTIRKQMPGAGKIYRNYEIDEIVSLPLSVSLSYASYFEAVGASPNAQLVVQLEYDEAGTSRTVEHSAEIDLSPDWRRLSVDIDTAPGAIIGYSVFLRFSDIIAMILIDRLDCRHSGQNWAIDPECEDMQFDLSDIYKNILKPWGSADDGLWTFAYSSEPYDVPLITV